MLAKLTAMTHRTHGATADYGGQTTAYRKWCFNTAWGVRILNKCTANEEQKWRGRKSRTSKKAKNTHTHKQLKTKHNTHPVSRLLGALCLREYSWTESQTVVKRSEHWTASLLTQTPVGLSVAWDLKLIRSRNSWILLSKLQVFDIRAFTRSSRYDYTYSDVFSP